MSTDQAHVVVAVSMVATAVVVVVAQDWLTHLRNWVGEKTQVK